MKTIKPRNGNVLLRLVDASTTSGGIITGVSSHDRHMMEIVAVGDGYLTADGQRVPINLEKGQRVYMAAGVEFSQYDMEDGTKLLIAPEAAVLGIEEDDGTLPIVKSSINLM